MPQSCRGRRRERNATSVRSLSPHWAEQSRASQSFCSYLVEVFSRHSDLQVMNSIKLHLQTKGGVQQAVWATCDHFGSGTLDGDWGSNSTPVQLRRVGEIVTSVSFSLYLNINYSLSGLNLTELILPAALRLDLKVKSPLPELCGSSAAPPPGHLAGRSWQSGCTRPQADHAPRFSPQW